MMKKTRLVLNGIAIFLLVFQLLGYLGTLSKDKDTTPAEGVGLVAYYIGFNLPVIIAAILFVIAQFQKKKMSKKDEANIIDSIGKD